MIPHPKSFSSPRPAWLGAAFLALAAAFAVQADTGRAADRAFAALIGALQSGYAEPGKPSLPDYRVEVEARPIAGVAKNLSGLAWDPQRRHLWAVVNEPPQLLALGTGGDVLSRHALDGFQDVEGVAWLGDGRLLLAEERRQALVVVPVPDPSERSVSRDAQQVLTLRLGEGDNAGFEGAAYDPGHDRLYVVKEHSPRKLYEVRGLRASRGAPFDIQVIDRESWIRDKFLARDFSSVEHDPRTGHLVLLSDASRLALELDAEGRYVGYQPLAAGFAGLREHVPQAEGIAVDEDGKLYVVSEPNLFYAFRPE